MAGSSKPLAGIPLTYVGLFILDLYTALKHRIQNETNTNYCWEIMVTLQIILDTHNPCAQLFKYITDVADTIPNF